ncbi:CPBP family intramembrane metalloprotease [Candidatus Bathyarchaeota archaeon]|nr:CPBP family intramembrane metalloprotease [Candidatus Bathyarchaeota archaeon]
MKKTLLGLPFLLMISTAMVFHVGNVLGGTHWGYVAGFAFYDACWCIIMPIIILNRNGEKLRVVFQEEEPLFQRKHWYLVAFMVLVPTIAIFMYIDTIASLPSTPTLLIAVAIPATILNGTCEEIYWRGLYTHAFKNKPIIGWIYPAACFSLWHLVPQVVVWEGGFTLVISSFFLGLPLGLIAFKTRTVTWTAIIHGFIGIIALGAPLGEAIFTAMTGA